jgi:hypothetical protein
MEDLTDLVNKLLQRIEALELEIENIKSRLPHDSGRMGA